MSVLLLPDEAKMFQTVPVLSITRAHAVQAAGLVTKRAEELGDGYMYEESDFALHGAAQFAIMLAAAHTMIKRRNERKDVAAKYIKAVLEVR